MVNWYGDYPFGVWPWAKDALGDAKPRVIERAVIDDGIPYERIAAMEPDLIIGLYAGITEETWGCWHGSPRPWRSQGSSRTSRCRGRR